VEPTGRQGQFRLKLPSDKLKSPSPATHSRKEDYSAKTLASAPVFLPPDHKDMAEDPAFATPSLYDLTLKLNADPGLEAWWSNLAEILQSHYGAERVSLAVPGDATDLENVPWGQKAFFNQNGITSTENAQIALQDEPSLGTLNGRKNCDQAREKPGGVSDSQLKASKPVSASTRPSLMSRHSFGGFGYGKKASSATDSDGHQPLSKSNSGKSEKKHARISERTETMQSSSSHRHSMAHPKPSDSSNFSLHGLRQAVFPVARPLEMELDPLIKRAGVVKLFGRTNPIVLTREYSPEPVSASRMSNEYASSPLETVQVTPNVENPNEIDPVAAVPSVKQARTANLSAPEFGHYDEYEQVPQSPWSQSPAPSPAPRTHADQNPFFTSHTVDEGAFSKNPPAHDYSSSHPLEAIGVDQSKTLIHIPLLHGGSSNRNSLPTLRFPVAIVSLMTPIVPYPPNLRQSLAHLMPHLTTSFRLAQHYSQLERQVVSKVETPRYGNLLGLGGTFSDASSELELVAGLSGHVSYSVGDENSMSARASIASPSDRSSMKFSPAISSIGTPGFELGQMGLGSATQSPGFVSRTSEAGDSYFNVSQPKITRDNVHPQRPRLAKSKSNLVSSTPESPGKLPGKAPAIEESQSQDPSVVTSPLNEMRPPPPVVSPTQQSSRQASTTSLYAQLQRELPRPFSDTIAQLMLNSIPLHLFLAKPQSGEVIWTNSKFDAFRRSKPQEQKLRDPWQNIHSSERDHVSGEWANALRTGSQFTERVRVKRFNDESAYRWFIFRANPLLSSTGEVLYWIGSFLDIHEQHISELKAIQEREKFATDAKYRAFSNSIPQVVFEATENRGLIFVNEQWNLYTGQSLEEALNLGFARHVHPDDLDKCRGLSLQTKQESDVPGTTDSSQQTSEKHGVESALHELVRRGVASSQKDENGRVFYSTEIRLSSRGGDFRWHLVRLVRVETSSFGSEESSWYGTCTDINDRKNLERELNKAMSQLNNQMESKTKFFSNMSHEIRTPLNGILGTLPFILDTQLDSDQRRMLDTIQNSSTGLRELVDNILDVSRVEAGKMSMVNSWFHVRSMIEEVIDTIYSKAIDKNLEVNYLIDSDVPVMVIGDRFRIRQVLLNLVGNAVKFTSQGEVHIGCNLYHQASAKVKETEVFLNFDVVDTGKGFSSQDAKRLMQRFSQLGENGSQQNAGSGLGLFLSKQLVEMHGGKLTPSSNEGQGAKFSFNVKVDAPAPPSPSERPGLLRQPSSASRRPGMSRLNSSEQNTAVPPRGFDPNKSPDLGSPTRVSPELVASAVSKGLFPSSTVSSVLPTPDIGMAHLAPGMDQAPDTSASIPSAHLIPPTSQSSVSPTKGSGRPLAVMPEGPLSIVIVCPLDNTRDAAKQHIEQVIPPEVPSAITTLPDVDEWKDMMQSGSNAQCTHLVLNLPAADDILEVIQHISELDKQSAPVIVIISDPYQKRHIAARVSEFAATGKQVFVVNKPVKPSAFSVIFDPEKKCELSKDRRDDEKREDSNNFKTVSKMVKEVLGNKGYRILLVEDDETNRNVSQHSYRPCLSGILTSY
jgi:signal transduction histidine kinase